MTTVNRVTYKCLDCGEPTDMIQPYCDRCEEISLKKRGLWTTKMQLLKDLQDPDLCPCGGFCTAHDPCIDPHDTF